MALTPQRRELPDGANSQTARTPRERELPKSANSQRARTPRKRELLNGRTARPVEVIDAVTDSTSSQSPRAVAKRPVLLRRDSLGGKVGLHVSDCFLGLSTSDFQRASSIATGSGVRSRSVAALQSPFTAVRQVTLFGSSRSLGVRGLWEFATAARPVGRGRADRSSRQDRSPTLA